MRNSPFSFSHSGDNFLTGVSSCEPTGNTSHLTQELEIVLKTFGSYLSPYSEKQETTNDLNQQLEESASARSVNHAFLPRKGSIVLA